MKKESRADKVSSNPKDFVPQPLIQKLREPVSLKKPPEGDELNRQVAEEDPAAKLGLQLFPDDIEAFFASENHKGAFRENDYSYLELGRSSSIQFVKPAALFNRAYRLVEGASQKIRDDFNLVKGPGPRTSADDIFLISKERAEVGEIRVCEFEEAEETEAQAAERVERETKLRKKPGKKNERQILRSPIIGPLEFSAAPLSRLGWVSSLLQFCADAKLRDATSGASPLARLFPQEHGCPVISPSGRYVLRLHYQEAAYMVSVDDYFPVDLFSGQSFLPLERGRTTLWSALLCKALMKFFAFAPFNVSGFFDCSPLTALTGHVPLRLGAREPPERLLRLLRQGFDVGNMQFLAVRTASRQWSGDPTEVKEIKAPMDFKDHNISREIKYSRDFKDSSDQREPKDPSDSRDLKSFRDPFDGSKRGSVSRSGSMIRGQPPGRANERRRLFEDRVEVKGPLLGQAYGLFDFFESGDFNMSLAKQLGREEATLQRRYLELLGSKTKPNNADEGNLLRKQRRDLRLRLRELERSRAERANRNAGGCSLICLHAGNLGSALLDLEGDFTHEEVHTAKICILNGLIKPPNQFETGELRVEEGSLRSHVVDSANAKKLDMAIARLGARVSDFSSMPGLRQPGRHSFGAWLDLRDLPSSFDLLFAVFPPGAFTNRRSLVSVPAGQAHTLPPEAEIFLVPASNSEGPLEVLANFSPLPGARQNCGLIQKFDFDRFAALANFEPLDNPGECKLLELPNENQVFRLLCLSFSRFIVSIYSRSPFKVMSIPEYLTSIENWKEEKVQLKVPQIFPHVPTVLCRVELDCPSKLAALAQVVNPTTSKLHLGLRLVLAPLAAQNPPEFPHLFLPQNETSIAFSNFQNITLPPGRHVLALICETDRAFKEQALEFRLFSKNAGFRVLPLSAPLDFLEPPLDLPKRTLLREFLFFPEDSIQLAGFFMLIPDSDQKKTKEVDSSALLQASHEIVSLALLRNGTEIARFRGPGKLSFNFVEITKSSPKDEFEIQVSSLEPLKEKVLCFLRLTGSNSLAIAKNLRREEQQVELVKSWETGDAGRAERAAQARKIALLKLQISRGENVQDQLQATIDSFKPKPVKQAVTKEKQAVQEPSPFSVEPEPLETIEEWNPEIAKLLEKLKKPVLEEARDVHNIPEESSLAAEDFTARMTHERAKHEKNLTKSAEELAEFVTTFEKLKQEKFAELSSLRAEIEKTCEGAVKHGMEREALLDTIRNYEAKGDIVRAYQSNESVPNVVRFFSQVLNRNKTLSEFQDKALEAVKTLAVENLESLLKEKADKGIVFTSDAQRQIDELLENVKNNPNYVEEKLAETKKKPGKR